MPIPSILYLSFNDGSDMRVNKEIKTLSQGGRVELLALGPDPSRCYAGSGVAKLHFVKGDRKSGGTLIRYFIKCASLLMAKRYHSVHIINEPQLIVLWLFLWRQKRVVLDIFDSIFLRRNRPGNDWNCIKKIVYAPVDQAIVTDDNRLGLLPDFFKKKAVVVPNYPYKVTTVPTKERAPYLVIMYYGWLGEKRGTETVRALLAASPGLKVLMAGWLADAASHALTTHDRVEWLGVLPQAEALSLAARKADYILCVYAPINGNNINASPNKIYDAIQTRTPVIINPEVKVAAFVSRAKIGYVLPQYEWAESSLVVDELYQKRESFVFGEEMRDEYTWENVDKGVLQAHGIPESR